MRTIKLVVIAVLSCSCLVVAQDVPRYEISTGYSYGSTANPSSSSVSGQGWFSAFGVNLKHYIALETDVSAQYNNETVALQLMPYSFKNGYYSFLSGPRVSYRRGRVAPFVHGLVGINRSPAYDKAVLDQTNATAFVPYDNYFGAAVGGGLEYSVSSHVAFRSQADYFLTGTGMSLPGRTNNFRVVGAIVFSFGGSGRARVARENPSVAPGSAFATQAETARNASRPPMSHANTGEPESSASQPTIQPVTAGLAGNTPQPIVMQPATAAITSQPSDRELSTPTILRADVINQFAAAPPRIPAPSVTVAAVSSGTTFTNASPAAIKVPTESLPTNAGSLLSRRENEANGPHTASSSDVASSQQWQKPAPEEQESLGEVARRYREQKRGHEGAILLSSDQSQNSTQPQESLGEIARRYREQKESRQKNQ